MKTLPYDCCRCMGENCTLKSKCLRHEAITDMEQNTPWAARYCREIGRESEGFIAIREEEKPQ